MSLGKPVKIAVGVIAVLLILFVGLVATLFVVFPPSKLKTMVVPQVEKTLGRDVEIEGLGLSFWPVIGARISGLRIADTDRPGFTGGNFVTLDNLRVGVRVIPLFKGNVEITKVLLEHPYIQVEMDSAGNYNFDDLAVLQSDSTAEKADRKKESSGPAVPLPITLEELLIKNASLVYRDRVADREVLVGNMNQSVSFSIDRELRDINTTGRLEISDISVRTPEVNTPLTGLNFTVRHDLLVDAVDGKAVVKELKASLQKVALTVTGTVEDFNNSPKLDLALQSGDISIADLLDEIPVSVVPEIERTAASGTMRFDATVTGTLSDSGGPSIDGRFFIEDGVVRYADLPKSFTDMNADMAFTQNTLTIQKFQLKMGENPIWLKARVIDFANPVVDGRLKAKIDLGDLGDVVKLPEGTSLDGIIDADIHAKGPVDPENPAKLDAGGGVKLEAVTVRTPAITKPLVADGNVEFSPLSISENLDIKIGESSLSLTGDLKNYLTLVLPDTTKRGPRPRFDFMITSSLLDTDEFLPKSTAASATKDSATETTSAGEPSLLLPAPLPGLDISGTISNHKLVYEGIELTNVNVKIESIDDILDMSVRARVYGGRMENNLKVNAVDNENLKVNTDFAATDVDMNQFVTHFNDLLPQSNALYSHLQNLDDILYGTGALKTEFRTTGGTVDQLIAGLDGTVRITLADGRIAQSELVSGMLGPVNEFVKVVDIPTGEVKFRDMRMRIRIEDEKAFFEEFRVVTAGNEFAVSGSVGFDASLGLAVENRLSRSQSGLLLRGAGAVRSGVKDLASGVLGDKAGEMVNEISGSVGPQADSDGRVTVVLPVGGNVSAPKPGTPFFKAASGEKTAKKQSPRENLEEKARRELEQKKKAAEEAARKAAEEARERVQSEARKRKEAAEKEARKATEEVREKTGKKAQEAKEDVKNKLKGLF